MRHAIFPAMEQPAAAPWPTRSLQMIDSMFPRAWRRPQGPQPAARKPDDCPACATPVLVESEMAMRIGERDWAATPLGPLRSWPDWLRNALMSLLDSPMPTMLVVGPELVQVYNDACVPLLGTAHPAALGQQLDLARPGTSVFRSPAARNVMAAAAGLRVDDQRCVVAGATGPSERRLTMSYTPVRDDKNVVRAVSVVAFEPAGSPDGAGHLFAPDGGESGELRSMFAQAPGYMAVLQGPDHAFELASPACSDLFGAGALAGVKLREVLPGDCGADVLAVLDQAYRSGKPYINRELRVTLPAAAGAAPAGRYLDLECHPILKPDGSVSGLFVHGHDVTHQAETTRGLQEAARRKEALLATLAHELRNPLAPIAGVSAVLRRLPEQGSELTRLGAILDRQAGHMRRLIDDLLDASRIGNGLLQLKIDKVDARDVIASAAEQTAAPIEAKQHRFTMQLPAEPLLVAGDSARMIQIVANLLHNAAKYTPAGGTISLQATAAGSTAQIRIVDNGIGLDPDFLPRVFEPFTQATRQAGASENGLGLGLALVRSLAELHGGSVRIESPGLGRGTTAVLCLPLAIGASACGPA